MSICKTEVAYLDERSKCYLGSPSIVRLPDGVLVAYHDFFGYGMKNANGECGLARILRSEDDGATWYTATYLCGAFWGNLFYSDGALYHLGSSQEYGNLIIRRSTDGGFTWTEPTDEHHGLLMKAGPRWGNPNYQTSSVVTKIRNRFCFAVEECDFSGTTRWLPELFAEFVISCPCDADLLEAENWLATNRVAIDHAKFADPALPGEHGGWLEGTVQETPDGRLCDVTRVHFAQPNKAAFFQLSDDFAKLDFDYDTGVIDFIGGHSKFEIRRDEVTGLYFTLTNEYTGMTFHPILAARNKLALAVSPDLRHWKKLKTVVQDESGLSEEQSLRQTGFQYVDWQFDGEDIIFLCRTAYRGSVNFHNSNRITYHVIRNFRKLCADFQGVER